MRRLGLIGAGGMADTLLSALAEGLPTPFDHLAVLVIPEALDAAKGLLARDGSRIAVAHAIHTELGPFLAEAPDLVAECAGHGAVKAYGPTILEAGHDLAVISIGSLSDDALYARLGEAARRGDAQLILPPGAVGGIDALVAARLSGLEEVTYTGRKPPRAWRGTPAETLFDLDALTTATTFYEGTAREAARLYSQNANVAATIALAGAGFDATRVKLVADPAIKENIHELHVRSACTEFTITLQGRPSPVNPKTSLTAGYSMAREIINRAGNVVL